jgi:cell wall-associated NlpC family hydrolase
MSKMAGRDLAIAAFVIVAAVLEAGCASGNSNTRQAPISSELRDEAAAIASFQIGAPYRYRSNGPETFDCSGLVQFSYARLGLKLPRSTSELRNNVERVGRGSLTRGDLVFFNEGHRRASHVGIYLGDDWFVHAPSSGKPVRIDRLGSAYWAQSYAFGGRVR